MAAPPLPDHGHDTRGPVLGAGLHATTRFDSAVTEECQAYTECAAFTRVYGRIVIEVEYADNGGRANVAKACAARGSANSIVYRERSLVPRGGRGYACTAC